MSPPEPVSVWKLDTHPHRIAQRRTRLLRRWWRRLPRRANLHRYPGVKRFAQQAQKYPELWQFKGRPVRLALYTGCALALLPTPGLQILIAIVVGILIRANLTVMVGTQFLTNPFTIGPLWWAAHTLGRLVQDWFGVQPAVEATEVAWQTVEAVAIGTLGVGLAMAAFIDLLWCAMRWEVQWLHRRHRRLSQERYSVKPDEVGPEEEAAAEERAADESART